MDIVLEVFDTFLFDPIYASLLPVASKSGSYGAFGNNASAPVGTVEDLLASQHRTWEYKPASQYLSFTPSDLAYQSSWLRDDPRRQFASLFVITWVFGALLYFAFATLSYIFVFDKETFNHPKYLKNQVRLEIWQTLQSLPGMAVLTAVAFWLEVRGYSKIYDTTAEGPGMWYNILQFPLFLLFTDFFIYWIHRGLHHPLVYKRLHKPHHKWIMPTPFASHAFHPLDGFAQSIPYHVFPFVLPLQKFAYIALFVFINIWTIMIHDGEYIANSPVINGAACHTMHHLYFNYNYGQFTTISDRLFGSYRKPNDELFQKDQKMSKEEWTRQSKEMEKLVVEVEGKDDRSYLPDDKKKQ